MFLHSDYKGRSAQTWLLMRVSGLAFRSLVRAIAMPSTVQRLLLKVLMETTFEGKKIYYFSITKALFKM